VICSIRQCYAVYDNAMQYTVVATLLLSFAFRLTFAHAPSSFLSIPQMHHGAVLTTPTGEFSQLMSKVFRNLDVLLPSLYGDILPMWVEAFVAVIVISVFYGYIGAIQLVLFFFYTLLAYRAAKAKAERNKSFMTALFSEWGKVMSVATSYERAHFFDNVQYEINKAGVSFDIMGSKITAVSSGEHKEAMVLQTISLTITALFLGVVLASLGDEVGGLEQGDIGQEERKTGRA